MIIKSLETTPLKNFEGKKSSKKLLTNTNDYDNIYKLSRMTADTNLDN
jgi:hypothetical protein